MLFHRYSYCRRKQEENGRWRDLQTGSPLNKDSWGPQLEGEYSCPACGEIIYIEDIKKLPQDVENMS